MNSKLPFYDPALSYDDNFKSGPFGSFRNGRKVHHSKTPQYTFVGLPVNLPFGIAAGPLLNSAFVNAALDKAFDLVVYKTVRTHEYKCHPWPNVLPVAVNGNLTFEDAQKGITTQSTFQQPLGITNSFGVPSADPDFWQSDMKKSVEYAKPGQIVIGSFQGTIQENGKEASYIQDFVLAAKLIKETGVPCLEVNLSCPNEGTSQLLCFDIHKVKKIVTAIKEEIGNTPLIVKMAYFSEQDQLTKFITEIGPLVEGMAMINTIPAKVYTPQATQALPGEKRLTSGICGKPILWAGLEMVRRTSLLKAELGLKCSIIGVGGVSSTEDFNDYIEQGADAVMCATGAMWNPELAVEIKKQKNII